MRKLVIFLILANVLGFAQIDSLWVRGTAYTNMPAWFGANTERGLTYNPVTNKVYVVSRNGGNFVKAINSETGADLADLSVAGLAGGTYLLNDIESSQDGQMFMCNLVISATEVFKIYRYQTELSDPAVVFESDFGGTAAKRMGDNITVIGSVSDNSVEIWVPDITASKIQVLGTTDNGATFTVKRTISLPAGTLGSAASVYPIPEDSLITLNGAGKNLTVWKWDGTLIGQVSGGIISTGTTATKLFKFPNSDRHFISTFQYVAQANARIVDMDGKAPEYYRNFAISPNIGTAANLNGTGDISFKYNSDGSVTMFVLGTNNGIGAYKITRPYYINGRLHENYIPTGTKQNNNAGFGPNIDIQKLYYNVDQNNLYIAGEAKLNKANNDGIVVYLNVSNLNGTGVTAGNSLGGVTNGGHLFGDATNPNFKNDFETHFGFAMNMGGTDSLVFFDAVKYSTGNKTGAYLGSTYQGGSATSGPATGGIFTANSITFAFDSAYGSRRGFEIRIPLSEIGNPTSVNNIQLFAAVVSATAYFSDVTVPGNVTSGNIGFNANFLTQAGGPYHTGFYPVPAELVSFTARTTGNTVKLEWGTASEKNNHGFYVEKSSDGATFTQVGFVTGKGTTSEYTTYNFTEENVANGMYFYRLRQMDYDGTCEYSSVIEADVDFNPNTFMLSQNYPNPFNPSTVIKFTVPVTGQTSLKVYNALGQEVATLFSQIAEAGTAYSIDFNAAKLVSGVYLYELKSGVNSSMKKMMLIK
ncbi:MAG: T9SS type A sorting domain-containing protein [Ignavibacteriaceae bacterium]|jgi:hypothetical protein|nr:T9SS type A sorting domain-containing protein [Ignavibacteriaceae bacterium]